MLEASASHILVETEEVCQDLKEQIEGGLDFAAAAAEFSACPVSYTHLTLPTICSV